MDEGPARAQRWEEEVNLLKEEMRRVLVSFRHKSTLWKQRTDGTHSDARIQEGCVAYALRQSDLFSAMVGLFEGRWSGLQEQGGVDMAQDKDDTEILEDGCEELVEQEEQEEDDFIPEDAVF